MQKARDILTQHPAVNWVAEVCGPWDIIATIFYQNPQDLAETTGSIASMLATLVRDQRIDLYIEEYKFDRLSSIIGKRRDNIPRSVQFAGNKQHDLDTTNLQILKRIASACRTNNTTIGNELNISEDAVRARIASMEKQGIITGYTITIDPYVLGLEGYTVEIQLAGAKDELFSQVRAFANLQPQVSFCARTAGTRNTVWTFYCKNRLDFTEALRALRTQFGNAIVDYDVMLGICEYKEIFVPETFFKASKQKN